VSGVQQLTSATKRVAAYTILLSYVEQRNDLRTQSCEFLSAENYCCILKRFTLLFIGLRCLFIYGTTYRFFSVFKQMGI
jgi:hypothetical protein